jgi:hypothetical protein
VQQVGAKRHRPAVVVRDHVRRAQIPVGEQVGEELALHVEGDGVLGIL